MVRNQMGSGFENIIFFNFKGTVHKGPVHTRRRVPRNWCMQVMKHTVVNGSVHTARKQHQSVCMQLYASSVNGAERPFPCPGQVILNETKKHECSMVSQCCCSNSLVAKSIFENLKSPENEPHLIKQKRKDIGTSGNIFCFCMN